MDGCPSNVYRTFGPPGLSARDRLAQTLYTALFHFVLYKINAASGVETERLDLLKIVAVDMPNVEKTCQVDEWGAKDNSSRPGPATIRV